MSNISTSVNLFERTVKDYSFQVYIISEGCIVIVLEVEIASESVNLTCIFNNVSHSIIRTKSKCPREIKFSSCYLFVRCLSIYSFSKSEIRVKKYTNVRTYCCVTQFSVAFTAETITFFVIFSR